MNFQEWYKTMPKLTEAELRISIISWDKCKEEVLKILNTKGNSYWASSGEVYFHESIEKEIENL